MFSWTFVLKNRRSRRFLMRSLRRSRFVWCFVRRRAVVSQMAFYWINRALNRDQWLLFYTWGSAFIQRSGWGFGTFNKGAILTEILCCIVIMSCIEIYYIVSYYNIKSYISDNAVLRLFFNMFLLYFLRPGYCNFITFESCPFFNIGNVLFGKKNFIY